MTDDDMALYRCPMCRRAIGIIDECGALVLDGGMRTVRADLVCTCGRVIFWRRSDVKLERLVRRVRLMRVSVDR